MKLEFSYQATPDVWMVYEDAEPGSVNGTGKTREDALANFVEQLDEDYRRKLDEKALSISDATRWWVPVGERLPEPDNFVLAFVDDGKGRTRRVRAKWVPKLTVESSGDWDEFAEYDEAKDTYYTPEGWYECNEYEETNWKVDDPVTHWMPLPEAPK